MIAAAGLWLALTVLGTALFGLPFLAAVDRSRR